MVIGNDAKLGKYAFGMDKDTAFKVSREDVNGTRYFYYTFSTALKNVSIGNNVEIGEQAFIGCTSLTSVTIPSGVKTMGYWAFKGCTGLVSLVIREGVTSIGERSFSDCTALRTVTIPVSMKRIENEAFIYCSVLETVYYAGTADQWRTIFVGSFNYKLTGANIVYNHR